MIVLSLEPKLNGHDCSILSMLFYTVQGKFVFKHRPSFVESAIMSSKNVHLG